METQQSSWKATRTGPGDRLGRPGRVCGDGEKDDPPHKPSLNYEPTQNQRW